MKKKELQDLRTKGTVEVQKLLFEKKAEIARFKLELTTGKHKNVHVVKNARRDLRQIATVLASKKEIQK